MTSAAYLASMRANGLRLLTWAPRETEPSEAMRRHLGALEEKERQARAAKDVVALVVLDARIRRLLREGMA